jgi:O-antigen/teichoic acid export membrane protein
VPNGVAWWLINAADRTIVALFLGVAANGIFAVAYKFPLIFTGLFSFFGMSWTESASVHINSPDRDKFFSQTMNASIRLFGSLGIAMIAFIPLIFSMIVNKSYQEAYLYIPILIAGAFFNSIVGLYSAIYIAKKMTKQVASTTIFSAAISISFTLIFMKFIGLYAAAFAMAIAYLSMAVYRHIDVKKYVKITYQKRLFAQLTVMYVFVIGLYYLNNLLGNLVSVLITITMLVIFNRSIFSVISSKVIGFGNKRKATVNAEQEIREDSM